MSHSERKRQPDYAAHPVEGQQTILDVFPGMRATTDADGHRTIKIPNSQEVAWNRDNQARDEKGPYFDPKTGQNKEKSAHQSGNPVSSTQEDHPQKNRPIQDNSVSVNNPAPVKDNQSVQNEFGPVEHDSDKVLAEPKQVNADKTEPDDILSAMSADEIKESFSNWLRSQQDKDPATGQSKKETISDQPNEHFKKTEPAKEISTASANAASKEIENQKQAESAPWHHINEDISSPTVAAFKAAVAAYNNDPMPESKPEADPGPAHIKDDGLSALEIKDESSTDSTQFDKKDISASAYQKNTSGTEQAEKAFLNHEKPLNVDTPTVLSDSTEKQQNISRSETSYIPSTEKEHPVSGTSSEQYAASKLFSKGIRRFSEEDTVKRIKGCSIEDLRDVTDDINEYLTVRLNNGHYYYSFFDIERLRKIFTYISNQPGGYDAANLLIYCDEHFTKPYDNARSDMAALPAQINDELKNIRGTVSLEMRNILMPVFSNFTQELKNTNASLSSAYEVIRQQNSLIEGQQKQLTILAGSMNDLSDQMTSLSKDFPDTEALGSQMDSVKNDITSLIKSNAADERKNNESRQRAFEEQKKALEEQKKAIDEQKELLSSQLKDNGAKEKLHEIEELLKSGELSVKMPEINIPEPKDESESIRALEQQVRSSQGSTSRTLDKIAEVSDKIDMLADIGPAAESADSAEILKKLSDILSKQETTEKGVSEIFNKFDELQNPPSPESETKDALQDALVEVDDLKKQLNELQNALSQKTAQADELSRQNDKLDLLVQKMLTYGTPSEVPVQPDYSDETESQDTATVDEEFSTESGEYEYSEGQDFNPAENEYASNSDEPDESYSDNVDNEDNEYQDAGYNNSEEYSNIYDYKDSGNVGYEDSESGLDARAEEYSTEEQYQEQTSYAESPENGYEFSNKGAYTDEDVSQAHENGQLAYDDNQYDEEYPDGYSTGYTSAGSQAEENYSDSQYEEGQNINEPYENNQYADGQYPEEQPSSDYSYDEPAYNGDSFDSEGYATDEIRLEIPSQNITGHYHPLPPDEEGISEIPKSSFHSRPNIVVNDMEDKPKKQQKNSRRRYDEDDEYDDEQEVKKPKKKKGFFFHH